MIFSRFYYIAALLTALAFSIATACADVMPAPIFADHMILQRAMAVPVWGNASPGEEVTVSFAGQTQKTTAGPAGKWLVKLDALQANARSGEMTISGKNLIVLKDVLVGEVWLASGQSNMTMRFRPEVNPDEFARSDQWEIRTANVGPAATLQPQDSVPVTWSVCSPKTIARDFSAVGYFFANRLHDDLKVPVAIVHSSWEGTPIEPWISREALLAEPAIADFARLRIQELIDRPADDKAFGPKMAAWEEKYHCADTSTAGVDEGWGKPTYDASAWKTVSIPADFRAVGLSAGGVVWFRKEVDIPAEAAGKPFELNPGYTVDTVMAYWNGVSLRDETDHQKYYPHGQGFAVPAELVKAGKNVVSVRIFGHAEGHFWCTTKEMRIPGDDKRSHDNQWQTKIEMRFPDLTPEGNAALPPAPSANAQSTASCLFNGQIHTLIPYAIRGAIWYQGESSVDRSHWYARTLRTLIHDWRQQWGEGDFPFYIVQLANVGRPPPEPEESDWAEVREAQTQVSQTVPNTGLAVAIDIGEENDIHPRNKRATGNRLALNALARTYGFKIECSGPIYQSMRIEGAKIRIKFTSIAGGLVAQGGDPRQFAIAGPDKNFVWASAKIDGDTVLVWNDKISTPIAVRYAWAKNPAGCNLYNTAGLPASPFRTDSDDATAETTSQRDARMAWWREARFGIFIHWGIYAQAAGQWEGKPVGGGGEWIMTIGHIPMAQYESLANRFDPVHFDAEQWAQTARAAGMKYAVITAKHHDGFCMFDTKVTPYNVVQATPWQKDPLAELSAACRKHGIRFCVYYSIMDWHHPDQAPFKTDPRHPEYNPTHFRDGRKAAYVADMKRQLRELIAQYHPGVLWFDGEWMGGWTAADGKDLYEYLRGLDPDLIVNDRIVGGDFGTPEQMIPATGLPGRDWETCMTLNNTWGYKSDDTAFKSPAKIIANLIDAASKGGNYLLNVGPNALGEIPQGEVDCLKKVGDWLEANGEAIYGTTACPFHRLTFDGRCTRKGNTLYLMVFNWPKDGIELSGVKSALKSARYLDGSPCDVISSSDVAGPLLKIAPPVQRDPVATVLALHFAEPLQIEDTSGFVRLSPEEKLICHADDAAVHGKTIRLETVNDRINIGYWYVPSEYATWEMIVPAEGDYTASITYATPSEIGQFELSAGDALLKGQFASTDSWESYKTVAVGKLHLRAGRQTLIMKPVAPRYAVINLRAISLEQHVEKPIPAHQH